MFRPYGADTIIIPVFVDARRRGPVLAAMERLRQPLPTNPLMLVKAPLKCDGPNSCCEGQRARGVFPDPSESAFMLCKHCFFKLVGRRGKGGDTER